MGCQKAIAEKIHQKEADYVLALKGNQGTLSEDVRLFFETETAKPSSSAINDQYEEADKGHGRIEMRKCLVSSQIDWLEQKLEWPGFQTKFLRGTMKERARSFRKNMTDAEKRMWYFLRNRRLNGYKFVREYGIGTYIADFVCREKKLIIEIDGGQHMEAAEYDKQRTEFMEKQGYKVLRVWNNEVFQNTKGVLETILNLLEGRIEIDTLTPAPLPSQKTLRERGSF
jgi:very-short-patch-repair endonuclease